VKGNFGVDQFLGRGSLDLVQLSKSELDRWGFLLVSSILTI
jgi:hypothetical protein